MIQKEILTHRKLLRLFLICLVAISYPLALQAQAVMGARELGLGQAVTALPGSAWASFSNPAMIGAEPSVSFFGVRYYGLAEISDMAASVVYPTSWGIMAGGVHRYGFDLFNESRYRIGYKNESMGFHYGGVLNYNYVSQGGGYGSTGAVGIDLGLATLVIPGVWLGAKATNLNQPDYGTGQEERLPRNLSLGLSYWLSDIALVTTEVYKESSFPLSYRGGVEVLVLGGVTGRAGVTTAPQSFSGGFGYRSTFWGASIAVHRHENRVLGYSPALDLSIFW